MSTKNLEKLVEIVGRLRTVSFGSSEQAREAFAAWEEAQAELAALRAALTPFADLSSVYVRRAETFGWKDTDGIFGAADITKDVTIRVADCRAALKALGEES